MRFRLLLLLFFPVTLFAQQTITGTITDAETNTPIPGVNVLVKNTNRGAVSDFDGIFTITATSTDTLVFSFLGYKTVSEVVGTRSSINISLANDAQALESVIVTGYQTQRKRDITGAVSVADVEEMNKQSAASPIAGLKGRIAGMDIASNGSPSSPTTIRIRGVGTLNNNDPLYIIDGVPTKAGLHELNPNDIASLQVLKDASAASIYGSRAANGVIIITTKEGKLGEVVLSVNAQTSISSYTSITEMMDTQEYGKALWQANVNAGIDPNTNSIKYRFDWGVNQETGAPELNKVLIPEFLDQQQTLRSSNTNWFEEISRVGVIQDYNVSLSNGTEKGNYYTSFGFFKNEGIIKTSKFDRFSLRLNADYKLFNDRVVIGENLSITKTSEVEGAPINAALQALPIIPVRTFDGTGWGGPVAGMNDRQNPVRLLEDNKQNDYDFLRLFGSFYVEANLTKNLKFRTNLGLDYGDFTARRLRKRYESGYLNNPVNRLESSQTHDFKVTWSNTLNYNKTFNDVHELSVLVGTEYFWANTNSFTASREDFVIEDEDYTYLDAGTGIKNNSGFGAENILMSYFGKVNYSLLDRYLVTGTLRYDGSSRFGENNRFGTFPAFSLGWRISEEEFFKDNVSFINELKFRYGFGITGNQEIDNNAIFNVYVTDYPNTAYDIDGSKTGNLPSGYKLIQNANPNLKWEESMMSNFGLDFELFNQKLYGSAEYYIKETSDILILPPYIATLGEGGNQFINGASMENKGFELSLGKRSSFSNELQVDLNANISLYKNKITKLPSEVINAYGGNGADQNILGRPVNSFYGYVADGLFRSEEEVVQHADQPGKDIGRIRYSDLNGDGVVNADDQTWIGAPHPDFTYGFNANVSYKNFDLSFLLQGVSGIDVINDFKYSTDFWSVSETGSNKATRLLDAYSPTNTNSSIPAISLTDSNFESRFSTYFVENGSYLKVRNAQLGYSFEEDLIKKWGMKSMRIYIGGDNLGILLKSKSFTGIDPENPGFGYPNPLLVKTGFNLKF